MSELKFYEQYKLDKARHDRQKNNGRIETTYYQLVYIETTLNRVRYHVQHSK